MNATFVSLGNANYRTYAWGAFVSNVGIWMQGTAQAWLIFRLTGSASLLGLTIALQLITILVFAGWGGVLAESYGESKAWPDSRSSPSLRRPRC